MKKYLHYSLLFMLLSTGQASAMFGWFKKAPAFPFKHEKLGEILQKMRKQKTGTDIDQIILESVLANVKAKLNKYVAPEPVKLELTSEMVQEMLRKTLQEMSQGVKLAKPMYQEPRTTPSLFSYYANWMADMIVQSKDKPKSSLAKSDLKECFDEILAQYFDGGLSAQELAKLAHGLDMKKAMWKKLYDLHFETKALSSKKFAALSVAFGMKIAAQELETLDASELNHYPIILYPTPMPEWAKETYIKPGLNPEDVKPSWLKNAYKTKPGLQLGWALTEGKLKKDPRNMTKMQMLIKKSQQRQEKKQQPKWHNGKRTK